MLGGLAGLFLLSVVLFAALATKPTGTQNQDGTNSPGLGDTSNGGQGQDVDSIKCESHEQLAYHIHAHLFILVDGKPLTVSSQVGIPGGPVLPKCFYWLHTHDTSGMIHIESPDPRFYTLGQFFDIWGQPLNRNDVATYPVKNGQLAVIVDGQPYDGDPRDVPLKAHTQVVLEIGQQVPPPEYAFPPGA